MEYFVASDGITGKDRKHNGDGLVMKHGEFTEYGKDKDILFAVAIHDMSDEDKRGILSAAYVRSFNDWYENEISDIAETRNYMKVKRHWKNILDNARIITAGLNAQEGGGYRAMVTAVLMIDDEYISVNTGSSNFAYIGSRFRPLTGRTHGKMKADKRTVSYNREPSFREGNLEEGMYVISTNPFFSQSNEVVLGELAGSFKEPGKKSVDGIFKKMSDLMDKEMDSVTVIARPVIR